MDNIDINEETQSGLGTTQCHVLSSVLFQETNQNRDCYGPTEEAVDFRMKSIGKEDCFSPIDCPNMNMRLVGPTHLIGRLPNAMFSDCILLRLKPESTELAWIISRCVTNELSVEHVENGSENLD